MTEVQSLLGLATLYSSIGTELISHTSTETALQALSRTAVLIVPGAEHAGVTRGQPGRFETVAPTDELPLRVDAIQYELGTGPCVDAVLADQVFRTGDLRTDPRWPEFGHRAYQETGVVSMLSFRLFFETDTLIAGLNMYSTTVDAFDDYAQTVGTLLATHGSLAVAAAAARERAQGLDTALQTRGEIGIAMGVLMNQHKLTRGQAFDLLRVASQHTHRKLHDIATDVADTGTLRLPNENPPSDT